MIDGKALILVMNLWYITLGLGVIAAEILLILIKRGRKERGE